MTHILVRDPLHRLIGSGTPLPDDSIVSFLLGDEAIEVRHKGTYLEIHRAVRGANRLTIEPRYSNEIWIRLEPEEG